MQYESVELMRGVWGLEARLYGADEIATSFHLQSAVHAGALVPLNPADTVSADKPAPASGVIDLSDGADETEARLAGQTLRQRRGKLAQEKES